MKKLLTFLTLLMLFFGVGWAESVTTLLDANFTGVTSTNYTNWEKARNGVTFKGNSAKRSSGAIQMRSNNNSGIVSTTSIGTIKKIAVTWDSNNTAGRTIDIYGNNSAYSSPSDLYNSSSQGTKIGSLEYSSTTDTELTVTDSYAYIGLRSTTGAIYISQIIITWEVGGSTVETVATPTFSPEEGTYTEAQNVTISCSTSGATIHYTTDGNTPTTSSPTYSSAIPVSSTTTIKAIATKTGMTTSAVATATYTIETPPAPGENEYELVTAASQLAAGDKIIIASTGTDGSGKAMSTTQNNNNRGATDVTISNSIITPGSSVQIITLEKDGDNWLFNVGSGYLYAASSSSNHLKTETTPDANGNAEATISITSNAATVTFQGNNTRNLLKYNSGNDIFSCYASGQSPVYIYKKVESTPQSSDVYIIGQVDGHDTDPWVSTEGVKMTYNSTNDNYAANIYCTGVNNGTHEGYSLFLFAKSLPYDWNTTSNLYGSGADGSYWGIGGTNESAFGEEIPLYEGSKKSYRLPAGLYTVTVDLDYTGHEYTTKSVKVTKRDVTMTISPSSAYFAETQTVTMASNLTEIGGKIYYTTNGNDPRDPNSGRIEYTGELTISETTTFKAVAFIGNLYSEVVEKTYTKTPAAPVITPNGGTIYADTQVTITAEEGTTIYYTTDGSTPTPENGTQYTAPFTVSATTTVKARAYVGDVYSSITTAEFTYSNVQPSTGDFVLVTSSNELVAGNEYIIVTTYEGLDDNLDPVVFNYAMGALTTGNSPKGSRTTDFTLTGTIGASGSRIAAGSEVNVLTLGGSAGVWTLKQSNDSYISLANNTNISGTASSTPLLITVDSNDYDAYIGNNGGSNTRQILFSTQNSVFGNYASSNVGNKSYPNVYLYTRESNAVQPPVFTPAGGVYDVPVDVTISCATTGASIYYTTDGSEPSATNGTLYNGEEFLVSETTTYKAVAVKNGNTSSVVTAEYTIAPHTAIETVTLDYSEPFTNGIGKFTVQNVSGFAPVWTLDGAYGIKGTSYSANTNPTNNAAVSRFLSPIIDMTDAVQPELTFSHQINSYFTNVANQCQLFIRETTNGTSGTWVQLPITFSDPVAAGGWTNDVVDIDLSDYAGKKVQISFLYTNPTEGSGAGTWEIQNFVVADNSEYKMVNNIAEFLALENGTKAKFRNPVTVLYDYAQYSSNSYHEYIWVKDESGYMQFYLVPTLNSSTESSLDAKAAYYENGDIIPAGFVVVKNYYENGKYVQAYSAEALEAGFEVATQKGLADPEYMDFDVLDDLDASNTDDVATWCNHYITLEKIKLTSSSKNFNFQDENGTTNSCVGYNKYNGDGSLLKDGTTSADVIMPTDLTKFYNVKGIIQLWQGGWEFMPIEFTEWKEEEMTLRTLCQDGVVNHDYKISNNLLGVYSYYDETLDADILWVKDDNGQSIHMASPVAPYTDNFAIEFEDLKDGNGNVVIPANTRLEQQYYDQSNWCQLILTGKNGKDFESKIINGGAIEGRFTDKLNPTMTGVTLTEDDIYSNGSYAPNYYIPASFVGNQSCNTDMYGEEGHGDFFFMTPKPQEYATIVWAIWDGEKMNMPTRQEGNSHDLFGEFSINLSMNQSHVTSIPEGAYSFHAIIRKVNTAGAPALKGKGDIQNNQSASYMVYPLDIDPDNNPSTGINTVDVNGKAVKSVKYVNVAGQVSDRPFSGVNIVVTEYTDGSRTTTKVLRK